MNIVKTIAVGAMATIAVQTHSATLDIRVVPRFGAFNHMEFRIDENGQLPKDRQKIIPLSKADQVLLDANSWQPMYRPRYQSLVEPELQNRFKQAKASHLIDAYPPPNAGIEWDLITTAEILNGYSHRRVLVKVVDVPENAKCDFVFAGGEHLDNSDCRTGTQHRLNTNRASAVKVTIRDGERVVDCPKEKERCFNEPIPEDFLVLALGDSFMSGQGNPDRRHESSRSLADCASDLGCRGDDRQSEESLRRIWMDSRCQRSAWATPIQTGLKLANQLKQQRGAITVVNFACSGAEVDRGLTSQYAGQLTLPEFHSSTPNLGWKTDPIAKSQLAADNFLSSQIDAAVAMLNSQERLNGVQPKNTIDALIIDGGGNDNGFAKVVFDLTLLSSSSTTGSQQKIDSYVALVNGKQFNLTTHRFPRLLADLKKLGRVKQIIASPYPNPTLGSKPGDWCTGSPADSVALKVIGRTWTGIQNLIFPSDPKDLWIDAAEAALITNHVLTPLNTSFITFANSSNAYVVNAASGLLAGKGWCAPAGSDAFDPRSERWIRKADESYKIQGDIHGTMHPTSNFHYRLSELISEAIVPSINAIAKPSISPPAVRNVLSGNPGWLPPQIEISAKVDGAYSVCVSEGSSGNMSCSPGPRILHLQHNEALPKEIVFREDRYKSGYSHFTDQFLRVDAKPPKINCVLIERSGQTKPCSANNVAGEKTQIKITSSEDIAESGIEATQIFLRGKHVVTQDTLPLNPDSLASYLQEGFSSVEVVARDRVGNRSSEKIDLAIDRTPPKLRAINDSDIVPDKIFVAAGENSLRISFEDNFSGVCTPKISNASTLVFTINSQNNVANNCDSSGLPPLTTQRLEFDLKINQLKPANVGLNIIPLSGVISDGVMNQGSFGSGVDLVVLPSRCRNSCPLSTLAWTNDRRKETRAEYGRVVREADATLGMRLNLDDVGITEIEFERRAAWINFISGRVDTSVVNVKLDENCVRKETPSTVDALLASIGRCSHVGVDAIRSLLIESKLKVS